MRVAFVCLGENRQWASRRWRAEWVARQIGADIIEAETIANDPYNYPIEYDAYVFIKIGIVVFQKRLAEAGKKVFWDLCDPTWWYAPKDCRELLPYIAGAVLSCKALAEDFRKWSGVTNVHTVPDRVWLSHYPEQRLHGPARPARIIWYGAAQNRITLYSAQANLERLMANGHDFELTIYDDRPDQGWPHGGNAYRVYHALWSVPGENATISSHDIALCPPYPGPWGKVKSNNKSLTAWACGLPSTDGQNYDELADLVAQSALRRELAAYGMSELLKYYKIEQSALEWERILCAS